MSAVCGKCDVRVDIDRMFWIAYYANLWVYPVLEVLRWSERLLFLVTCWLIMFACYFTGELLTNVLWREYRSLYPCLRLLCAGHVPCFRVPQSINLGLGKLLTIQAVVCLKIDSFFLLSFFLFGVTVSTEVGVMEHSQR